MTEKPEASFGAREAQPLDVLQQLAKTGGWKFFEADDRLSTAPLEDDAAQLANDARLVFETEQGRRVLEWLADTTVRRPVWSYGIQDAMAYVAMREGQNAVFFNLLKLLAFGREEKPPQREGT